MSYHYRKLKELKPEIHNVDMRQGGFSGSLDSRIGRKTTQVPVKLVHNSRSDMELQNLFTKGALKWEGTGRCCGECLSFYPDPQLQNRKQGRCRSSGFKVVSEDTPADERNDWTDPASGIWFSRWPSCDLFTSRERMSLH